jgi:hypothetical protein
MLATRLVIQRRPGFVRCLVLARQFFQRRFLVKPFAYGRFVIGIRFRRRDARRLRRVCARVHVAFFRRRLMAGDISCRTIP